MGDEQQLAQGLEVTGVVAGNAAAIGFALNPGWKHQPQQATVAGFNQGRAGAGPLRLFHTDLEPLPGQ
ncbi:hypothetical protein D9M71_631680 [compost metagenome]